MTREVVLLGSQRRPSVQHVVRELDPHARVATVTAGWQEREPDDAELNELLGGRAVNLSLHARWLDVLEKRPGVRPRRARARRGPGRAAAASTSAQLDHALRRDVRHRRRQGGAARGSRDRVLADALELVRMVDEQHLVRVREAHLEFYDAWRPQDRPVVAAHREEVREILQSASGRRHRRRARG